MEKDREKFHVISSDNVEQFGKDYFGFKEKHQVTREFCSTQVIGVPNPSYHPQLNANVPQLAFSVVISAIIFYTGELHKDFVTKQPGKIKTVN